MCVCYVTDMLVHMVNVLVYIIQVMLIMALQMYHGKSSAVYHGD